MCMWALLPVHKGFHAVSSTNYPTAMLLPLINPLQYYTTADCCKTKLTGTGQLRNSATLLSVQEPDISMYTTSVT